MKHLLLLFAVVLGTECFAKPECSIDFARVTNSLGVVAGHAKGDTPGPLHVSVKNADLIYTTLADEKGNWALTFRYFSPTVTAEAWQNGHKGNNRSLTAMTEVYEGGAE